MNNEYLSEERYQKSKKKLITIALIILIIGLLIGGLLIIRGIINSDDSYIRATSYAFAFAIIVFSVAISLSIFLFANQREITAFQVQQNMPIAQEGIDKIAPTMGNAAKEIAKGVKEGMKDDEKSRD